MKEVHAPERSEGASPAKPVMKEGLTMWKKMKAKYPKASCLRCYGKIRKGQMIEYHTEKKTVRHADCEPGTRGSWGGKARKVA